MTTAVLTRTPWLSRPAAPVARPKKAALPRVVTPGFFSKLSTFVGDSLTLWASAGRIPR